METEHKILKEEHHWTSEEKLKHCGYGEWVEEADVTEFEYLGYEASVIRVFKREHAAKDIAYFGGHLCVYVRIPNTHPYFKNEEIDLDVHGGITFNEAHEEHWIGFDCAHLGDYVPTMEHLRNTIPEMKLLKEAFEISDEFKDMYLFNPVYRNVDYCIEECKKMIRELHVISVKSMQDGE